MAYTNFKQYKLPVPEIGQPIEVDVSDSHFFMRLCYEEGGISFRESLRYERHLGIDIRQNGRAHRNRHSSAGYCGGTEPGSTCPAFLQKITRLDDRLPSLIRDLQQSLSHRK